MVYLKHEYCLQFYSLISERELEKIWRKMASLLKGMEWISYYQPTVKFCQGCLPLLLCRDENLCSWITNLQSLLVIAAMDQMLAFCFHCSDCAVKVCDISSSNLSLGWVLTFSGPQMRNTSFFISWTFFFFFF